MAFAYTAIVDAKRRDVRAAGGIVASDCCYNLAVAAAAAAAASTNAFDCFLSNKIDLVATHFADINLAIDDALD